jgi:hypothetical protein
MSLLENRFAAMMLFQFRVEKNNLINKKRICEERIYHIYCQNKDDALREALDIGKNEEFDYVDDDKKVFFEFVGILDIVELDENEDSNVVWSRFVEKREPMERKNKIIPPKNKLSVFKSNKGKLKL